MSSSPRRQPRVSALSGRRPAGIGSTAINPVKPAMVAKPITPEKLGGGQKTTVNVSRDLADQVKDAFWLARGEYRTFSAWVEDALRLYIDATKAAHDVDTVPRRPGGGALRV